MTEKVQAEIKQSVYEAFVRKYISELSSVKYQYLLHTLLTKRWGVTHILIRFFLYNDIDTRSCTKKVQLLKSAVDPCIVKIWRVFRDWVGVEDICGCWSWKTEGYM